MEITDLETIELDTVLHEEHVIGGIRFSFIEPPHDEPKYYIENHGVSPAAYHILKKKLLDKSSEKVDHPDHYAGGRKFEPIDVIEDWELGFCLGNAIKYISRAGRKDDCLNDLLKAKWYLEREIRKYQND